MINGLLKLFLTLFSYISLKYIHFLGEISGFLLSIVPNSIKSTTKTNLKLCFSDKTSKEIDILTRKSLKETSKSLLESGKSWIAYPKLDINKLVEVEGRDLILRSLEEGRGVILFTPHIGNIEILINFVANNFKSTIPYTPAKISALDSIMNSARDLMGANMVKADSGGVKSSLIALKEGNLIMMASDQVPKKSNGIISNFFGVSALTVSLISTLSKKTKSPCHSVVCLRRSGGQGFRIIFSEKINQLNDLDVQDGVNLMNRELEKCIMKAPEQYAWEYKRFKHSTFESPY
jgi:KDO2-lipid IV(A) lauroyltransferase